MPIPSLLDYLYDEDITGESPENIVLNELHLVTSGLLPGEFNIIIPKAMPYYRESMVVRHVATNRVLIPGVEWQAGNVFESASYETEWVKGGLYGSILIMDRTLLGQFKLDTYNTLGGEWTLPSNTILELLLHRLIDPRTMTYEVVCGKPYVFPPTGHNHPLSDWTGFAEVISGIDRVAFAIENRTDDWLETLPHLMNNYYVKEEADIRTHYLVNQIVGDTIDTEIQNFSNILNEIQGAITNGFTNVFTKAQSDSRYYLKTQVYTRSETDSKIRAIIDLTYNKADIDVIVLGILDRTYSKVEMDAILENYNTKDGVTDILDIYYTKEQSYSKEEIDSTHYTKVQSDERYYTKEEIDARGVPNATADKVGGLTVNLRGDQLFMRNDGNPA